MHSTFFSKGPENIPAELKQPTKAFRMRVVLAILGLSIFLLVYLGLMWWFAKESYQLFRFVALGIIDNTFWAVIAAICFAVLALFMFKSLFIFRKRQEIPYREIKAADEPELIAFIHSVAEEVGAPKPHKIYLSDRVNACVFYDLSFVNLLIPSKKNLEIGMGLVNVMNITEFKAILAHEFGHFAQRSMLLGRYVYVAQQVATQIIYKRDALDKSLGVLSSIDIRIAWIGWILSIGVWAIRSLIEVLFGIVVVSERALSREMEFQADRVAVSATGSDALIFGLHKLRAADKGFHAALDVANSFLQEKKWVSDVFALQTHYIEKMRVVLDDPDFGQVPSDARPDANYRVFKNPHVNPPEMWSTHPADTDRERNAKEIYIASPSDTRQALKIFRQPETLRHEVTKQLMKTAGVANEGEVLTEEAEKRMDSQYFNWRYLHPEYKGVYLNRYPFAQTAEAKDLYDESFHQSFASVAGSLYTDQVREDLELERNLQDEMASLRSAREEFLTGEKRQIFYKGEPIRRRHIPAILQSLEVQLQEVNARVKAHDTLCRSVHLKAAEQLDIRLAGYHKSLVSLLHFLEHSLYGLNHRKFLLEHRLHIAGADGRFSEDEIMQIIRFANGVHELMKSSHDALCACPGSPEILKRLNVTELSAVFSEPYKFTSADRQNIQSWMNNFGSWYELITDALARTRAAALDTLIELEEGIRAASLNGAPVPEVQVRFETPADYPKLVPGTEQAPEAKLSMWDRFQGGIGLIPTAAKFVAAACILALAVFAGFIRPEYNLHIHNGFQIPMVVNINGEEYTIGGLRDKVISLPMNTSIRTTTADGRLVEEFDPEVDADYKDVVYNIAGGSYMISYLAGYGTDWEAEPEYYGPRRWIPANNDYILKDAPDQIYASASSVRSALVAMDAVEPSNLPLDKLKHEEIRKLLEAHLTWEPEDSRAAFQWLTLYGSWGKDKKALQERIRRYPAEVISQRVLLDLSTKAEQMKLQAEYEKQYARTHDPDMLYLSLRELDPSAHTDARIEEAVQKYPLNPWLSILGCHMYARQRDWGMAAQCANVAGRHPAACYLNASYYYRILRLTAAMNIPDAGNLRCEDATVSFSRALESGDPELLQDPVYNFLYELSLGDMNRAGTAFSQLTRAQQMVYMIQFAASDGAPADVVERAGKMTEQEMESSANIVVAIGYAIREGKETGNLEQMFIAQVMDEAMQEQIRTCLEAMRRKDFAELEKRVDMLDNFQVRAFLELAAYIVWDAEVPVSWRMDVNYLVLPYEKPWFSGFKLS